MRSTELRLHYQPKPERVPRWMRRVWGVVLNSDRIRRLSPSRTFAACCAFPAP